MPRKAAKGSPRYYFHQGTEDAIIRHNKETRPHMREEFIMNTLEHLLKSWQKTLSIHLSFITLMFQVQMLYTR